MRSGYFKLTPVFYVLVNECVFRNRSKNLTIGAFYINYFLTVSINQPGSKRFFVLNEDGTFSDELWKSRSSVHIVFGCFFVFCF